MAAKHERPGTGGAGSEASPAPELDPLIHAPARLRIMVTLAVLAPDDMIWFVRLQEITELTAGNLITHLRKLEEAGYVTSVQQGAGQQSRTQFALTKAGRKALAVYKQALRALLDLDGAEQPSSVESVGDRERSGAQCRRAAPTLRAEARPKPA